MKSKIIVGALLVALCAMGTSNESMAKGMKVKVSKQMEAGKSKGGENQICIQQP